MHKKTLDAEPSKMPTSYLNEIVLIGENGSCFLCLGQFSHMAHTSELYSEEY